MTDLFSKEAQQAIISKLIADALPEDKKLEVIQKGITDYLLKEREGAKYGSPKKALLQEMFEDAIRNQAERLVNKAFEEDGVFNEQVQLLFQDLAKALFAGELRGKMIATMADNIASNINKSRY